MINQDKGQATKSPPSPSSVPPSDPRYPIWGRVFMCRIPRIAQYSTDYLERRGLPTSGIPSIDRALMSQLHPCYITINHMVELYHQHQMVSIIKQDDVKTIYEICQDYTFDWADQLKRAVYTHNVPFADLIKIDEFAEAVYQHAAHQYGDDFARTFVPENVMKNAIDLNKMFDAIDKRVKNRGKEKTDTVSVANMYSPQSDRRRNQEVKQEEKKDLPPRPSVRDIFVSYMDNFGGRL